jgi:hypothetical protein
LGIAFSFTLILGSTFAANINLNNNQSVEFGQGVVQTVACDQEVTLTPYSSFVNEPGGGSFKFTSLTVTGIDEECDGKVFTIKAYKSGQDNPLVLYTTDETTDYSQLQIAYNDEVFTFVDGVTGLGPDDITATELNGFTVTLYTEGEPGVPPSEASALANDVDRITIESRDLSESDSYLESGPSQSLLAAGLKSEVDQITEINSPHLSNGTYWYNTPSKSRGFSKSPIINQDSCDWAFDLQSQPLAIYRLCWHTEEPSRWADSGYRMGTEANYSVLERRIYTSTNPTYYPFGPQINVSIATIESGGWTLCYSGSYENLISNEEVSGCSETYILYFAQRVG